MLRFSLILACFSLFSVPSDSLRWLLWFHDNLSLHILFPFNLVWWRSSSSSSLHFLSAAEKAFDLVFSPPSFNGYIFIGSVLPKPIDPCHMAATLVRGHRFHTLSLKFTCMGMSLGVGGPKFSVLRDSIWQRCDKSLLSNLVDRDSSYGCSGGSRNILGGEVNWKNWSMYSDKSPDSLSCHFVIFK